MQRNEFLATAATTLLVPGLFGVAPVLRQAQHDSGAQAMLAAGLPSAVPGLWTRYVMGFGLPYQQQIGFGVETTPLATRYFIETQIGMPGGSCNPNTVKKAYLKTRSFGTLLEVYGIEAYVSKSGTLLMLDQDEPTPLRLLDSKHLYTSASGTVTERATTSVGVPAREAAFSENAIKVPSQQHAVQHVALRLNDRFLRAFEIWSAPHLPLGVARMRADVHEMPPFELRLDSYGFDFKTQIAESLDSVRAQQS